MTIMHDPTAYHYDGRCQCYVVVALLCERRCHHLSVISQYACNMCDPNQVLTRNYAFTTWAATLCCLILKGLMSVFAPESRRTLD